VPRPPHPTANPGAGLVARIAGLLPVLTPAEQRVARLVVADPGAAAARTVTDLATAAGTSEATVIRFCRSVGVPGYPQLRLRLAAEAGRPAHAEGRAAPVSSGNGGRHLPPAEADMAGLIAAVAAEDARAITDTAARLDPAACAAVVDAVGRAGRVDVHGADGSAQPAAELRLRLQRIGVPVFGWPDGPAAVTSAALLGPGDVAIGLSHSGRTASTVQVLRRAADQGARTVAVTTFPRSALGRAAELVLATGIGDTPQRRGPGAGRAAQLTVVDVLVLGVTRRRVTRPGE
jgi:DNA-binding MurR/RpiR family transcriptional regulator